MRYAAPYKHAVRGQERSQDNASAHAGIEQMQRLSSKNASGRGGVEPDKAISEEKNTRSE